MCADVMCMCTDGMCVRVCRSDVCMPVCMYRFDACMCEDTYDMYVCRCDACM